MAISEVTPEEARELLEQEGCIYLDVRSVEEYESGHPDPSCNIPFLVVGPTGQMQPNGEFLQTVEANFSKNARLLIGCMSGGRSAGACQALEGAGFTDLKNVAGGFGGSPEQRGWRDLGLPVRRQAPAEQTYEHLRKK